MSLRLFRYELWEAYLLYLSILKIEFPIFQLILKGVHDSEKV